MLYILSVTIKKYYKCVSIFLNVFDRYVTNEKLIIRFFNNTYSMVKRFIQ